MINHDGTFLPDVTFGLPVFIATATLLLILIGFTVVKGWNDPDHGFPSGAGLVGGCAAVLVAVMLPIGLFGWYPYEGDYHRLQPATGTVRTVDNRFLAASQYVVVTYDTGLTVRCDDSRCATVRPGQQLRLLCTKEYQLGSPHEADGWGCRWDEQTITAGPWAGVGQAAVDLGGQLR